jgi:hypothetical protein
MNVLQTARIIADFVMFLELTDEEILDPDTAVEMAEFLAGWLEGFEKEYLRELIDAFQVIAPEYTGEAEKLVRDIAYNFYLEEELAADDPERLAELEAIRDARID